MDNFSVFKHKLTGQVVNQPSHYGRLYPDLYEEVDPKDLRCTDCGVPEKAEDKSEPEVHVVEGPEPVAFISEPAPVPTRRKRAAE